MADLQFNWFGIKQASKSVFNFDKSKAPESKPVKQ